LAHSGLASECAFELKAFKLPRFTLVVYFLENKIRQKGILGLFTHVNEIGRFQFIQNWCPHQFFPTIASLNTRKNSIEIGHSFLIMLNPI
jgi:hypothetical protein